MHGPVFESELRVLELLWRRGSTSAAELAEALKISVGWSKTTSYTVIKKCEEKSLLRREKGPSGSILCTPLISKAEVQNEQVDSLIDRLYDGAADQLVAALVGREKLTAAQAEKILGLLSQSHE